MRELRDRMAKALYRAVLDQAAYVETAYGKYVPDPTDPDDLIVVDGRISFPDLADAILAVLKLHRESATDGIEPVDDPPAGKHRYVTEWQNAPEEP